ncbi:MAG TPA: hypothetical protein VMZ29_14635 [Candidatus Bathyarchaeia archaeon]|nr:hypothetical protein [Candidatus Bathyarchaeia archaeon]
MFKSISKCSLCGKIGDRDEMVLYNFPNGSRIVCKKCYLELPPDPIKNIPGPKDKRRPPESDFFPPVD